MTHAHIMRIEGRIGFFVWLADEAQSLRWECDLFFADEVGDEDAFEAGLVPERIARDDPPDGGPFIREREAELWGLDAACLHTALVRPDVFTSRRGLGWRRGDDNNRRP